MSEGTKSLAGRETTAEEEDDDTYQFSKDSKTWQLYSY